MQPINSNNIKANQIDELLLKIADYVHNTKVDTKDAMAAAKLCLLDSLACGMLALNEKKCAKLLGPFVPGTEVPNGSRVPGTDFKLDPIKATFDIGACIRWLDYNDTWLAQEWGHPSDNISGILAVADFINKQNKARANASISLNQVLEATIKSYEIQGILALDNSFNRVGLDHVVLVKVATSAVVSKLLGGGLEQTIQAVANAWLDGQSLRVYRHGNNTAQRKSWAAGDAASRGVELAWFSVFGGEPACSQPLSASNWGVVDVFMRGREIILSRSLNTYVIENILFKVSFPAEFHGQTAVEAAILLHDDLKNKLDKVDKILINTQESGDRIINKSGPLTNYADRDHCLQYMVAVGLLEGRLDSEHYLDTYANSKPEIDSLRNKMIVKQDIQYSRDYLDLGKRAIPNSIEVIFQDGTKLDKKEIYYPLGHKSRRQESIPYLQKKYQSALATRFSGEKLDNLLSMWDMPESDFGNMNVTEFLNMW